MKIRRILAILIAIIMLVPCTAAFAQITILPDSEFEQISESANYTKTYFVYQQDKSSGTFSDINKTDEYYDAVEFLTKRGVINGYSDNTFKPANEITRAEAAAIIVRAANLSIKDSSPSTYSDVSNDHWAKSYIMAATQAGIINGIGDAKFAPQNNVTHNQIIKMVICMLSLEEQAINAGGWPSGYLSTAAVIGIIDANTHNKLYFSGHGDRNATRSDVAQYVYKALMLKDSQTVEVSGKKYYIGMNASELGTPDEKLLSTSSYTWYVYGTKTYKDFVAVGVWNDKVVAIASAGPGFIYNGYKAGDIAHSPDSNLFTDKNDSSKIHGVFIDGNNYDKAYKFEAQALSGESKMNFHCTNAFRVSHGKSILTWSDAAARAAQLHSQDMAENDYFSHDSQDGTNFFERLHNQGVKWITCGENISAGYTTGFYSYNGWVNSEGHRRNMLKDDYEYLGVGGGYYSTSTYSFYLTQDFFS